MKPSLVKASNLPSNERFVSSVPRTKPLTTIQQLVADNKKKIATKFRRRNTQQVKEALLQAPVEIGANIWIPDQQEVWVLAQVMEYDEGVKVTVQGPNGKQVLDLREIGDIYKENPRAVDDMTSLYYIHEAGILENLNIRSRLKHMKPYTFMANVLIAVNPLCRLVEPNIHDYIKTQMGDKPPHPYAIAEVAFQQMALRTPSQCQSIVISGESGAGKTETSKIVLKYLTSREHINAQVKAGKAGTEEWKDVATELDLRLLDTNPILEAFGNAKTLRNHNSSRFGKFMKLQFSPDRENSLVGAYIETYLLEKSRLVYQIPGERNFHIFYFLLAGADEQRRKNLHLGPIDSFHYLNQSGCVEDSNIDDEILYDEVVSALDTVEIAGDRQDAVFGVLAGLLHLGNIALVNRDTSEGDAAEVVNKEEVELAASLLGMDAGALRNVICQREILTRGEVFTIKRNAKEGGYVRDAIAKSIYQYLFDWIVKAINKSLGHGAPSLPFIGVLDIFGFESFKYNDFEQLLINYANEALQATFNKQVFISEQELFKSEGIEVGKIIWPDNRECIDLISSKPNGILPLLDAEARTQKPTDEKWNTTLHKTITSNAHFLPPHAKDKKFTFIIQHFATKVEYHIGNFIDKNDDTIPKDLEDLVLSSESKLVKEMYEESNEKVNKASNKKISVSGRFCTQMDTLIRTLDDTRCNFIRCVKPNKTMTCGVFDKSYVVDQLRCTGMLATCELLKVGLPTRVSYSEICAIYKPVLPEKVTPMFEPYTDRTFTEAVLWAFRVDPEAYRLGRTRVFFKTGKIALLDALLKVDMKKMGPWIVGRLRKWLARRRWRYATAKIIAQRGFLSLLEYLRKRKASVIKMQSIARMFNVRKKFLVKRNNYRELQRRKQKARKNWKRAIAAVRGYNSFRKIYEVVHQKFLAEQARKAQELAEMDAASIRIQSIVRGKLGRKRAVAEQTRRDEAILRARLAQEKAAAAMKVRGRWRSAVYAVIAQRFFLDRFNRIHTAHVMAAEAKKREEEERLRLEEERRRAEEMERMARLEEEAKAATKIQAAYRGFEGRREAQQRAAAANAQASALAAALAAEAAAEAAAAASAAQQAEEEALRKLNEGVLLNEAPMGVSGSLGNVAESGELGAAAIGVSDIDAELVERQDSLEAVDLSWMAAEQSVETEAVAGADKTEELAQAGRDLFGEGGEKQEGPLMEAEEENMLNPVERIQEFPTGPPIPFKGGIFTCTMLGHRKLQDSNWGDEYTEYVLRCTWGRDVIEQSKTAWLVGGRYNDFNALHQELKAAASGRRGKRAPWFPRFPKRHPFSSLIGKNQEESFIQKREKELNRYMTQVLTQMPDALSNIHMDRFMNLTLRTQEICEREAYAEARSRWEDEEREALANAAEAEPLSSEELQEVERLVHQLLEKIICAQGDVRHDTQLQEMMHAVKVLQCRVAASAQIGAGVDMELVPLAMQLQDDIQDAFNQYNDTLLALRLEQELS